VKNTILIKLTVNIQLIILLSCDLLIHWLPLLEITTFPFNCLLWLCMAFGVLFIMQHKEEKKYGSAIKLWIVLYIIYTIYLIYYIFISPQVPRDDMLGISESNFRFMLNTVILFGAMLSCILYRRFINVTAWTKATIIIIFLTSFLYFLKTNILLYSLYRHLLATDPDMLAEFGLVDSFTVDRAMGLCFFCNLWLMGRLTKSKWISYILFVIISVYCLIIIILIGQRGPILFIITTTMFYFFCKYATSARKIILYIFMAVVMLIAGAFAVSYVSSDTAERFEEIEEDSGSGRFGDDDSEYFLAWNQIQEGPLLGSYFRTTAVGRYGDYPHNVILELFMTFGLIFTLPMLYLFFKIVKISFYQIRKNTDVTLYCLVFIYVLSCFMTSGTIALNFFFWLLPPMIFAGGVSNAEHAVIKRKK